MDDGRRCKNEKIVLMIEKPGAIGSVADIVTGLRLDHAMNIVDGLVVESNCCTSVGYPLYRDVKSSTSRGTVSSGWKQMAMKAKAAELDW